MIPQLLLYKIMQLFAVMLLGFIIVKAKVVKSTDSLVLSKISLYLLMPANIIAAFNVKITDEIVEGILLSLIAAVVIHIILLIIDFFYKKLFHGTPVERASIIYSNAANLIIPIVAFILGDEWVIYSCTYVSVQLVLIWTQGVTLFSKQEKFNIKKILLNTNIIAIAVGATLMITGIRLPKFASDLSSSLGTMIGNVGMLIAGMTAADMDFKKMLANKRLYLVTLMRNIICPFIILLLLRGVLPYIPTENASDILLVTFLATMTPSAAMMMQFAQVYDTEVEYSVAINIITTVVCIVTMPVFVALYSL